MFFVFEYYYRSPSVKLLYPRVSEDLSLNTLIAARRFWRIAQEFFNDHSCYWYQLYRSATDHHHPFVEIWSTALSVCVVIKLKTSFNKQYFNVILQNVVPIFLMVSGLHIAFALAQSTILKTACFHSRNLRI